MSEDTTVWSYIRGFERYSLCDWPGRPCAVLFLGGCNLRCPTCHNGQLAWNMSKLSVISRTDLKAYFRDRAGWLDGVTVTGGEPTCVPGLGELLYALKQYKLPVKLDSNGMRPEIIQDILESDLVDVFAVDVKGPYHKYPELTGKAVSELAARANMDRIFAMAEANPDPFYFRLTKVPGLTEQDVETARSYLPAGFSLKLQEYVEPRREQENAQPNHEERRPVGDVVN